MALTPKQRQQLKAKAHALKPVILLGQHGLTDAVQKEIEQALVDHELIKIRVGGEDKEERRQIANEICVARNAELVQAIGKIIAIYRKRPAEKKSKK